MYEVSHDITNTSSQKSNQDNFLKLLWSQQVPGQLKSAPSCFKVGNDSYGVLFAGYDGVVQ